MPKNASLNGDGFRFYRWEEPGKEPVDVLSVTSIRSLAGTPYGLVRWQISNVVNLAMGTHQVEVIGPKGGHSKKYIRIGEGPGEFVDKMNAVDKNLDTIRKWLTSTAEEPRDIAAVRGSVVHKLIEIGTTREAMSDALVHAYMTKQWAEERRKEKPPIIPADISFVRGCLRQYWNMREEVPFVIIAREPQVFNLEHGYAGSADVLMWFLPPGTPPEQVTYWQKEAEAKRVTQNDIKGRGYVVLGDWKTAQDVYTDNVIQVHAYLAAEFVGRDGVRDERLTAILNAAMRGAIIHIRPDAWSIDTFDFSAPVLRAFLGAVALSRFLAQYPRPHPLFIEEETKSGSAPEETE